MALSTNANIASLQAQQNLNAMQSALHNSVTRLSTGLRINADRPQGADTATPVGNTNVPSTSTVLKISPEAMALSRMEATSTATSAREANDLIANTQTADAALGQVGSMLQRAGELASMSESGQLNAEDQDKVKAELAALSNEVNRMAQTTTGANGQKLLDGSYQGQSATVAGSRMSVGALPNVAELTGTRNGTLESSASIKKALEAVNTLRGNLSGTQAQASSTATPAVSNSGSTSTLPSSLAVASTPATRNPSFDVGAANETASLTRAQLLQQAGSALLAQANALPHHVLTMLRG